MKSKLLHFLIPLLLFPLLNLAQPINNLVGDSKLSPPSVSSIAKYSDTPVSFFTGVPNTSIPIYQVAEGTINLPISMGYHSAGVKVAETASWTGLGWSLMAGGLVSRTTQGIPDDKNSEGYYWGGAPYDPCQPNANPDSVRLTVQGAKDGALDAEPDIFHFNFAGYSGKFFFDPNGTPVLVPNQDILIEPITGDVASQNFDGIRGWKFITPDGTQYFFGGYASTPTADLAVDEMQINGNKELSTWYLINLRSYDDEYQINLSYVDEAYSYRSPATCQQVIAECANQSGQAAGISFNCLGFNGTASYHINRVNGQRLSNISSSTCSIDFIAETERLDLDPYQGGLTGTAHQLDTIRITTGNYCKEFILYQSYFETGAPNDSEDYRLRLDSLQEIACDASVSVTPYTFEYNTRRLPNRLSNQIDHWGFFNGALLNEGNDLNIPETEIAIGNGSVFNAGNSNREPNATFSDAAILEQINYPEGGFVHFDYEGNEYYNDETTESIDRISIISGLSNCTVPDASCCSSQNAMVVDSFSQEEIDKGRFSLAVTDVSATGAMSCNSTTTEIILKVFNDATNAIVGSVGYNINAGDDAYQEYDWDIFTLTAGTFYRIELEVDGAKGEFNLWRNETIFNVVGNQDVGGLRIQQITVHDGIDAARDIIKTYEYSSSFDPMRSSGVLYKMPEYGFSLAIVGLDAIYVALFSSTSITPLSDFDGYHIGYERVVEKRNGNGQSIYNHFIETTPTNSSGNFVYPIVPEFATVRNTQLQSVGHFRENGAQVAQTINTQDGGSAGYTFYDNAMFKTQSIPLPNFSPGVTGCAPLDAYNCYSMRTGQYLIGTVEETLDGVTTTTTYDYADNLAHLAPTIERVTNSDGIEYETNYKYVFNRGNLQAYIDMIDRNIIATPYEVTTEVTENGNTTLIAGTRTDHDFFDANGVPQSNANSAGADPYPHELFSYKLTFDESGTPSTGYWELEATIEKRFADGILGKSGYPEIAQTADWALKDSLDYENGIMVAYTYGDHKRTRTLHPNTRMTASRTDIDGQPVFYNYDQLMRLDTILARPKNSSPNPQNNNDFNVATTVEYIYPQMTGDRAFTKTRIDYAPEITGNSQFLFRETYAYADGIGRLIQTVERQHSPDTMDVVIAQEYDNQGRVSRVYEPFESSQNTGDFVASIPSPANQAYTETRYFNSPLNRVRGNTPPAWFETLMDYESNATNEVQNLATGMPYAANSLNKQIITDPDDKRTITYTDRRGRLVMTRRDSVGGSNFIETYQLYDLKERPIKIIPPAATLNDGNLVYSYLYNDDDQPILQKIPDKDTVYMQYDDRELLTAMQDGLMRDSSRWLVSILDDYGRTTQTGFYQNASVAPDPNVPTINNGVLTETFYDGGFGINPQNDPIYYGRVRKTRTSILNGYIPTNDFIENEITYDDFGRVSQTLGNNHTFLVMGSEQTLMQYDFADNLVKSSHGQTAYNSSITVDERMTYDHKGRQIDAFHQLTGNAEEHCSQSEYTARDLVKTRFLGGLGNDDFLQEVNYTYNAQRWLTQINDVLPIGVGGGGSGELNSPNDLFYMRLNYNLADNDLNARSQKSGNISKVTWQTLGESRLNLYGFDYDFLDRIKRSTYATETGSGKDVTDDFGTSYAYDDRGNIIQLTRKGRNDDIVQTIDSLNYSYFTNSNQIQQIGDDAPCPAKIVQAEDIHQSVDYRASQCITFKEGFSFKAADDGIMTAKIECVSGIKYTRGFQDRNNGQDYQYDVNGNLNTDSDKGITIKYNHLNLPYEATWNEVGISKKIEWLYDADGTKLRKTVTQNSIVESKKDYIGELEYESDTLEAIYHSEVRVVAKGNNTFEYQYNIQDLLGNTRVVFRDNGSGGAEIVTTTSYYPFGAEIETLTSKSSPVYSYLYNGIERNADFGLNWDMATFRTMDAFTGRWLQIDPLADFAPEMNPYRNAFNNPILYIDPFGLFETKKEAKDHAKAQGIKTGLFSRNKIRKQSDGTFAIENRKEHTSVQDDGELGIITAFLADAPTPRTKGTNVEGAERIAPFTGTLGTLRFHLGGNQQDGVRYNKDGYPSSQAFAMGTPPSGPAKLPRVPRGQWWLNLTKGRKKPQAPGTIISLKDKYLPFLKENVKTDLSKLPTSRGTPFQPAVPNTQPKSKWKHFLDAVFGNFDHPTL